ncbi:unnamed protein product [Sphenostylis stenocarpa]|uniref:Uncharacterized protein n=1 Tax=Sphenostylis stenocarpa TaxID=92480 RepID=A0AA86SFP0_9FABA|nr:unnamed protein product [Sphenostylis stenocarpa]
MVRVYVSFRPRFKLSVTVIVAVTSRFLRSNDCIASANNHIVCNIKDHDKTATTTTITSTEHEKFGFEFGSLRPMKYEQIAELLNGIAERFDWDKIMEDDKIIGLKRVCEVSLRMGNKHRGNVTEVK